MRLPIRANTLAWLETSPSVDVLIIGGGINGAGLLRELALNGVDALLVDQADYTAGATSASSRMIHGGLRYLENGEFRLVRESLRERDRLLRLAPHAVKPLPTTIPIFSRWSGFGNALRRFVGGKAPPTARGAMLIKVGLTLYDVFTARRRVLPKHRFANRHKALQLRPQLHPGIVATATYHDAQVALPERLCLQLIADATQVHPGTRALNYVAATGVTGAAAHSPQTDVVLTDVRTKRCYQVRPRVVVNATGGWIDFANANLGARTRWIGGTKGSHLVVDHPELLAACRGEQLFYENPDGRICIFFPINGRVLVGSTDIRIEHPDQAVCDEREVDYMLESIRTVFPALRVGREHILSRFCGVRPLPASEDGFTGRISRDHACRSLPADAQRPWPVYAMIGGKWTTFRAFAEQVADQVLGDLQRARVASSTDRPLPAEEEVIAPTDAEIRRIARDEAVVMLEDLLLRRTALALYTRLTAARFAQVAALVGAELGWTPEELAEQTRRARQVLSERHGVALASSSQPGF